MNVLYGLYRPDSGRILLRGRAVTFHSPRDAIRAGIGMIHQHFMPCRRSASARTSCWARSAHPTLAEPATVEREVHSLSAAYGLDVDPRAIVAAARRPAAASRSSRRSIARPTS